MIIFFDEATVRIVAPGKPYTNPYKRHTFPDGADAIRALS